MFEWLRGAGKEESKSASSSQVSESSEASRSVDTMDEKEEKQDEAEANEATTAATEELAEVELSADAESSAEEEESAVEEEEEEEEETEESSEGDSADAALHQFEHDDPLGPGYDLDGGELIDQQESHLPWQTDVATPKEFFTTELLYRFDVVEPTQRELFDGKYRIELSGDDSLTWSVGVGEDLSVSNTKEDAEIVFQLSETDFMELVNGRLNPQLAILAQKMKVVGDVRKAILFQELLIPAPE